MKYLLAIIFLLFVAVFIYFKFQDGRIVVNSEHSKVILLKGGYRTWTIQYSHGRQLRPDGTWKNLWHSPYFYYLDVRKLNLE